MDRRAFLANLTVGTFGLAGCSGLPEYSKQTEKVTTEPVEAPPPAEQGNPPTICQEGYLDLGIYAIDEPAFAEDWSDVTIDEKYTEADNLADDDVVIGITTEGKARAYPVAVLWVHEIVNDSFGQPLIVTFCSLCRSGMVANREINGKPTDFGVSGQLWEPPELESRARETTGDVFAVGPGDASPGQIRNTGNLVMFDLATGSYWSQILARAICGPMTDHTLEMVPSQATTWLEWRDSYPDTEVLLPPPHSTVMTPPG